MPVSNRLFFYTIGFAGDCFNYAAIISETFLANKILHASELQMGVLGATSIAYALASVWTGMLSDRVGKRSLLLLATAGMALAYFLAPHSPSVLVLCCISTLRALSTSFLWPPLMAWMTETSGRASFSGVLGGYNITWASGMLVGLFLGGWLFEYIGPMTPFYFAGAFSIVTFFFILFCTPQQAELTMEHHDMPRGDVSYYVRQGMMMIVITHIVVQLVLYLFPKVVGNTMGETAQSTLHALRMAGQISAFILMTSKSGWHFKNWPIWLAVLLAATSLVIISLVQSFAWFALGFWLLGMSMGVAFMLSAYYALSLMQRKGLGSGLQETLVGFGNMCGPLYGGVIATVATPRTRFCQVWFRSPRLPSIPQADAPAPQQQRSLDQEPRVIAMFAISGDEMSIWPPAVSMFCLSTMI